MRRGNFYVRSFTTFNRKGSFYGQEGRKRPAIFGSGIPTIPNLKVWAMENLKILGLTRRLWGITTGTKSRHLHQAVSLKQNKVCRKIK